MPALPTRLSNLAGFTTRNNEIRANIGDFFGAFFAPVQAPFGFFKKVGNMTLRRS